MDYNNSSLDGPIVDIKVVGVGGGGGNAVDRMVKHNIKGVQFIAMNTDKQVLMINSAPNRLQIGAKLTKGHGAGGDPNVGERAAQESRALIIDMIKDAHLVFITAGMGGGTGTGAAAVVAGIAKELGILTIGVVTKPFDFEGPIRRKNAEKGIENLRKFVDTIVIIPNEKLLSVLPEGSSVAQNYMVADEALRQAIKGITDLIMCPGFINVDFADIERVIKNTESVGMGKRAHMGIGRSKGDNKIIAALQQAVSSPLLETSIEGATKLIINYRCGFSLPMIDIARATNLIREVAHPECEIIFGNSLDDKLGEEVEITIIATGLKEQEPAMPSAADYGMGSFGSPQNTAAIINANARVAELIGARAASEQKPDNLNSATTAVIEPIQQPKTTEPPKIIIDDDIPPFLKKIRGDKPDNK